MSNATLYATNPATGKRLEPAFVEARQADVDAALEAAGRAFDQSLRFPARWSAELLEEIASQIMVLGDPLLERAEAETALPRQRLIGERARTVNQLKMFAAMVREGSWVDAVIETADPKRTPSPKPDLRRMLRPRGPVVVFGASNFPFAFGALGGDTASALAAGCPVVVKGHPSHPGTSALFAMAADHAVAKLRLPAGMFKLLQGTDHALSAALVKHPATAAVGFTGSLKAGRALFDLATARPRPIPVYAEMGSVNPVVILPGALAEKGESIAKDLCASVLLGGGQFCTKPGLIFTVGDDRAFVEQLAKHVSDAAPVTMLNRNLCESFRTRLGGFAKVKGVNLLVQGAAAGHAGIAPSLLSTDAATWRREPVLRDEAFGPAALLVQCNNADDAIECIGALEGNLTGTVHVGGNDPDAPRVLQALEQSVGRVIVNGYPTGVEVNSAIVHGGPYPATTDVGSTSVGTAAIRRWVRPLAWQDVPDVLLPAELKNANPLGIERTVNGVRTRNASIDSNR
jgi:NADP-dependent aldehyde dehydrogenase